MRRVPVLFMVAVGLMILLPTSVARATPTPPYLIVNHTTRECAERWIGDDCRWCDPLPGWEVVGLASNKQCPEGYSLLDHVDMACRPYKNQFCCTGGAQSGDCEDLVLNDVDRLCAFVDEVQGCVLPEGWRQRPVEVQPPGWFCPYDYQWRFKPLLCLAEAPADAPVEEPAATEEPAGALEPATVVEPAASPEPAHAGLESGTIVLLALVAAILVTGSALAWVVTRHSRR